jgi:hypothetical protein
VASDENGKHRIELDGKRIDGLRNRGLSWWFIAKTLGASEKAVRRLHAEWLRKAAEDSTSHSEASHKRRVGRPRRDDLDPAIIDEHRRRGLSWGAIERAMHAGNGTIRRAHAAWLAKFAGGEKDGENSVSKPPAPAKKPRK